MSIYDYRNRMSMGKNSAQRGFTLIEIVVVVTIIGILAVILTRTFGLGATSGAKAAALYESANKFSQNWSLLAQQVGTTTAVTGSTIPDAGKSAEDVLIGGVGNVAATARSAYNLAGIVPLTEISQPNGAGGYTVLNYPFSFGGGGLNPLSSTFTGVPQEIVLDLVQKYGSNVTTLAASDGTNAVIQYGAAAANGTRTVTILRPN